jgi:putative sigma-54 modulation protein
MRIAVKGRNTTVTPHLREHVDRRFRTVGRQVSELAELEIELIEVAEATLWLKGETLRGHGASTDMAHSINLCEEQLARQVKRHRDRRRKRRETRAAQAAAIGHEASV